VLLSRVMKCEMKEKVGIKKSKTIEEVKYFRCWGIGHFKWEYPNIKVEKKKRRSKKIAYVVSSQKIQ